MLNLRTQCPSLQTVMQMEKKKYIKGDEMKKKEQNSLISDEALKKQLWETEATGG